MKKITLGKRVVRNHVTFTCAFCSAACSAGYFVETDSPMVSHVEPQCNKFESMDPLEFLRACRLARNN